MSEDASQHNFQHTPELSQLGRLLNEDSAIEAPDVSEQVMAQFQKDLEDAIPCQYDFEFISTYFDNQLHCEWSDTVLLKQRIHIFEKHLPTCTVCNQALGNISELTDVYRRYLYRHEELLAHVDFSDAVIQAFQVVPLQPQKPAEPPKTAKWLSAGILTTAAACLILLMVNPFNTVPPASPSKTSLNVAALEEALMEDEQDLSRKTAFLPGAELALPVIYDTPEAYLLFSDDDVLSEALLFEADGTDVSAFLFRY